MKPNKHILLSGLAAAAVMAITPPAPAQEVTGTLGSPEPPPPSTASSFRRPIRSSAA